MKFISSIEQDISRVSEAYELMVKTTEKIVKITTVLVVLTNKILVKKAHLRQSIQIGYFNQSKFTAAHR